MKNTFKSEVISGLLWKFGERITAQMISFMVSIILARLLSPSDYGAVALVMVFITLANVFVSSGFGNALIQKQDIDNLDYSSVLYISLGISAIIYAVVFLAAPWIAGFYRIPVMCPTLRVLGIRLIVAAVNSVQQAYVSRNMMFQRFFWSTLFGTLFSGIVGIAMAYHGAGVWALVAQYMVNTCTDTLVLWSTVRWRPDLACSLERAKSLISYGWKLLVSALLDTGYTQLRSLIIGKLYTSDDLAFYNQGDKYPNLIVVNINSSISSVLFPALAKSQSEPQRIKEMTRRSIQVSSFIMWPLMIGLGVVAEPLIRIILTDKWLPCVPFLRIFCFSYGLWPIHTANLQAINAMGRSDLFLKLEVIKKGLGLVILLVSVPFGPLAIAWGLVSMGIFSTFINAMPNMSLLDYSYKEQLSDLLPPLSLSVVMALVIYPLGLLDLADFWIIVLQVLCGCISYLLFSVITRQRALCFILSLLTKKRPYEGKHL